MAPAKPKVLSSGVQIGHVDLPLDPASGGQDQLGIAPYYDGLAEFIQRCETPMTIAVQGDWGTGKTSALNFIQQRLQGAEQRPAQAKVIEFNTWLYSQFDLGDALVFSLAHEIIQPFAGSSERAKSLLKLLASLVPDWPRRVRRWPALRWGSRP